MQIFGGNSLVSQELIDEFPLLLQGLFQIAREDINVFLQVWIVSILLLVEFCTYFMNFI